MLRAVPLQFFSSRTATGYHAPHNTETRLNLVFHIFGLRLTRKLSPVGQENQHETSTVHWWCLQMNTPVVPRFGT